MFYYALVGFLIFLVSMITALVVYFKGPKKAPNRYYSIFSVAMAIYGFGFFRQALATTPFQELIAIKILLFGTIFIPIFFLLSVYALLDKKISFRSVFFIYSIGAVFTFINFFTPLFAREPIPKFGFKFLFQAGLLYPLIAIEYVLGVGISLYQTFKNYRTSVGIHRDQLKYLFWAGLIGCTGGAVGFALGYNINLYPLNPWSSYCVPLAVIIIAYAIVRHQFMDIEVIIKKTLVFAGLSASVVGIFVLATFLIQDILGNIIGMPRLWTYIVSAMIIAALIEPIKNFLVNATDTYLFQKKYNPIELIRTFSKVVLTELDLNKIAKSTVEKLADALKLISCAILIPNREGDKFIIKESYGIQDKKISYGKDDHMISYLSKVDSAISKNEKKSLPDKIRKDMELISADACLAIMIHKQLIGILCLGKKKSDQEYTKEDMDTLLLLADALGVAITNALAFEDVRQKEKLAAIGMLAAGIKHDIGSPINQMSSAVQNFLIARDEGDHQKMSQAEIISEAYNLLKRCEITFDKVSTISSKFADFAKPKRKAELELINVSESIEDAIGVFSCELQAKNVSLKKNIQGDLCPILADKDYMQQILFNIIKNASQAIEEAHRNKEESVICITAKEQPEKNIIIEISDTGVGIPEDGLDRIFEPYYSTKHERGGTGLGLAIVKELVERSAGKISVKSELGKGTTFTLEFQGTKI